MAKQKHTQGPWKVFYKGSVIEVITLRDDAPRFTSTIVCWQGFDDSHREKKEHLANARLIAAAPELLQLCQELLGHLAAARPDLGETPLRIYAKSVISKAGG